jgi:hypothetical protein
MRRAAWTILGLVWLSMGIAPDAVEPARTLRTPQASTSGPRGSLHRDLAPIDERARWAVAESNEESDPDPFLASVPPVADGVTPWTDASIYRPLSTEPSGRVDRTRPLRC